MGEFGWPPGFKWRRDHLRSKRLSGAASSSSTVLVPVQVATGMDTGVGRLLPTVLPWGSLSGHRWGNLKWPSGAVFECLHALRSTLWEAYGPQVQQAWRDQLVPDGPPPEFDPDDPF